MKLPIAAKDSWLPSIIREKLFRLVGDELPYAADRRDRKVRRRWRLAADQRRHPRRARRGTSRSSSVVVEKSIKRMASEARQDMQRMFDGQVFLEVFVKVKSGWADDERLLKTLGYD
jgi:GTP-binding protein Era